MKDTILRHTVQGATIGLVLFVGVGLLFAIPNPVTNVGGQAMVSSPAVQPVEEAVAAPAAAPAPIQVAQASASQPAPGGGPASNEADKVVSAPAPGTAAAQDPAPSQAAGDAPAPQDQSVVTANQQIAAATAPASSNVLNVTLQAGGVVAGRVTLRDPTGAAGAPAAGFVVAFFLNGQLVSQTTTGADGTFRLPGLNPGAYSVVVSRGECASAYTVEVLAAGAAGPAELVMSVGPCEMVAEAAGAEAYGMMGGVMGGGMMGGGGGGAEGGLGSLLGLAGLAGLAGLTQEEEHRVIITPASPFVP